ncbi:MAG: STAS domain-containing protein, partial [Planctomycetota bacterium]
SGSLLLQPATAPTTPASLIEMADAGRVTIITLDAPSLREPIASDVAARLIAIASPSGDARVRQAIACGTLRDVTSASVTALLRVSDHLRGLGGSLVLFDTPRSLAGLIDAAGFSKRIPIAASEADAVALAEGGRRKFLSFQFGRRAA